MGDIVEYSTVAPVQMLHLPPVLVCRCPGLTCLHSKLPRIFPLPFSLFMGFKTFQLNTGQQPLRLNNQGLQVRPGCRGGPGLLPGYWDSRAPAPPSAHLAGRQRHIWVNFTRTGIFLEVINLFWMGSKSFIDTKQKRLFNQQKTFWEWVLFGVSPRWAQHQARRLSCGRRTVAVTRLVTRNAIPQSPAHEGFRENSSCFII